MQHGYNMLAIYSMISTRVTGIISGGRGFESLPRYQINQRLRAISASCSCRACCIIFSSNFKGCQPVSAAPCNMIGKVVLVSDRLLAPRRVSTHFAVRSPCPPYPRKRHQSRFFDCPLWANSGHSIIHSITLSARSSSVSGTERPSAFAVLRLIASLYSVGACTGRSAGFSPLRMRST
jgi:hypothetical protein